MWLIAGVCNLFLGTFSLCLPRFCTLAATFYIEQQKRIRLACKGKSLITLAAEECKATLLAIDIKLKSMNLLSFNFDLFFFFITLWHVAHFD